MSLQWSTEELERELDFTAGCVEDSVAVLVRWGLAHRNGRFVFASGAAVWCDRLLGEAELPVCAHD
jgi:hypothetical protein